MGEYPWMNFWLLFFSAIDMAYYFIYLSMYESFVCMHIHSLSICLAPKEARQGHVTVVTDGCEPPYEW